MLVFLWTMLQITCWTGTIMVGRDCHWERDGIGHSFASVDMGYLEDETQFPE